MKLKKSFFNCSADKVAKELLGKILCRKMDNKILKAKIIETEAYFDESDPASWARFGKRKDNFLMWDEPGKILIKNVHKYLMLNFVAEKKGKAGAVLIRALSPLNFCGNCSGPGLITECLKIDKSFNGKNIFNNKEIWLEDNNKKPKIFRDYRVGVKNDLKNKFRFFIKGNR